MDESIIMLIVVGVLIIALAISFALSKKKSKENTKSNSSKGAGSSGSKNENVVPRKDMSEFITFDKIANDMIYQKKGEKYTMVIQCKGINYDLMSNIEQMAVEEGFIKFLNTLRTPIQLYVQTRSVNLTENINKYKERTAAFNDTYNEMTSKYNAAEEDIDVSKEDTEALRMEKVKYGNIAEYASDITRYVERMSLNKFMLQRNYYIIISYYKSEISTTEKFSKEEYEELCYRELYTRAQGIISSLTSCSVKGRILKSNELAELIYVSYNRDDQKTLDIKSALESGFYRLYTTSEDVRLKKQELLDQEIRKEAAARVEAAIQEGLKNGTLLTPEQAQAQLDKAIDKEAINIVNDADINPRTKEKVREQILQNRKDRIEKAKDERAKQNKMMEDDRLSPTNQEPEIDEKVEEIEKVEPQKVENINEPEMKEEIKEEVKEEVKPEVKEEIKDDEPHEEIIGESKNSVVDINNDSAIVGGLDDRENIFGSMDDEINARDSMISGNESTMDNNDNLKNTETEVKKTTEDPEDDSIV